MSFSEIAHGFVDRRSGDVFDALESDPLFAEDARAACDGFAVFGDGVVTFLKRRGVTLDEIERDRDAAARRADAEAERVAKFRSKQRQVPLRLDLLRGDGTPSLRAAARRVLELGGAIRRAEHGETIVVSLPERLLPPSENGFEAILERGLRLEAARAADVLSYAAPTVLAALDARKPLLEALDDVPPAI